jgi:hypothetical protein
MPTLTPQPIIEDFSNPVLESLEPVRPMDYYPKGLWNLQVLSGVYFSPVAGIGPDQPDYHFGIHSIRFGRLTNLGFQNGPLRGSWEPIIALDFAAVLAGPGNFFVGPTMKMRYNFVQPDRRLVPYFQLGAGVQYNDGYRVRNQNSLGQELEFLLEAQIGARYFFRENLSLDLEGGFIHLSNSNMASRNAGINSFGATFGFSYYFGGPRNSPRW